MPQTQRDTSANTDRILRILHGEESLREEGDLRVINKIATMQAAAPDFDTTKGLAKTHRVVQERQRRRRLRQTVIWTSAAAAILLVILLIGYPKQDPQEAEQPLIAQSLNTDLLIPADKVGRYTICIYDDNGALYGLKESEDSIRLADVVRALPGLTPEGSVRIEVPVTEVTSLILEDGSVVTLNYLSSITVPAAFGTDRRHLRLNHGEAYFDIARDPDRPMDVQMDELSVQVLGTTFNIKAYPDEPLSTTLVEGSVRLSDDCGNGLTLKPGYQAIKEEERLVSWRVDVGDYTAWVRGDFIFNRMPLSQIMANLERHYDIEVEFSDERLKKMTYTGVFRQSFSKDYIFSLLEKTTNLKIIHMDSGRKVIITTR